MSDPVRTWTLALRGLELTGPAVARLRLELLDTCRRHGCDPSTVTVEEWLYEAATKAESRR